MTSLVKQLITLITESGECKVGIDYHIKTNVYGMNDFILEGVI